jgi:hypothetical protein
MRLTLALSFVLVLNSFTSKALAADHDKRKPASETNAWKLNGNAGTVAGEHFLGTTDFQPLELKVNKARALRLEMSGDVSTMNIIAGSSANYMAPSVQGGTISGGGTLNFFGLIGSNSVNAGFGTIAGGMNNSVGFGSFGAAIGGGRANTIDLGVYAGISAGISNLIQGGPYSIISGGDGNILQGAFATISGGQENTNRAEAGAIGGGRANLIHARAAYSHIGGGSENAIGNDTRHGHIGGGLHNVIGTNSALATIGGGGDNVIGHLVEYGTIAGGWRNVVEEYASTIGGGRDNAIEKFTELSTIGGGYLNRIESGARFSTIGGGSQNVIHTNSYHACIPGGVFNVITAPYSFAAGSTAEARHVGCFVWSDTFSFSPFVSTANFQFSVRARGGARFVSGVDPGTGQPNAGVSLAPGDGAWATLSDRNAKENFSKTDSQEILDKVAALPLATWNYKAQDKSIRHLGPTAQDFCAAFGLGASDTTITTVDADGVALAAIQGLNQKLEQALKERDSHISALEKKIAELQAVVGALAGTKAPARLTE